MQKFAPSLLVMALGVALAGCQDNGPQDPKVSINKNPYPSTYQPLASQSTLITNATVLTGTGERLDNADVFFVDGKVQQVGKDLSVLCHQQRKHLRYLNVHQCLLKQLH
jgi:hypothetical protein